jgi:hypothetical protein
MKFLKIAALIFTIFWQSVFASNRVNIIVEEDTFTSLKNITTKRIEINDTRKMINKLQNSLIYVRKGQDTYIKVRNIAGNFAIIAIAIGAYTTKFSNGIELTGLKLMISSYVAVAGFDMGMIKLNQADIEKLSREIIMTKIKLSALEKNLDREVKILCEEDSRHPICYNLK